MIIKTGACGLFVILLASMLSLRDGSGSVSAQVFRGYYPGGGVKVQSDKNDHRTIIKGYYPGGKLEVVYEYENGKLNGTTRQYFENGVLKAEIRYRDDKRQGLAKYYYQNGMLMAKIEYENDMETGNSRFYDESGGPMKARRR
jgi:antitoxin component YwqK of YwqJK toxin-antitoxin module